MSKRSDKLKRKEGSGKEAFSYVNGAKVDAVFHDRVLEGNEKAVLASDVAAIEAAMNAGVSRDVAWALCAGPVTMRFAD